MRWIRLPTAANTVFVRARACVCPINNPLATTRPRYARVSRLAARRREFSAARVISVMSADGRHD